MRRIFLLAVLSVLPLAGGADEERARIKEQELAEVRERIAELTEKIERQTRRRDELGAELGAVEAAIGSARVRLEKIETEVRESRARLDDIARQQARRRGELGAEKERLAGQLRAAYTSGRQERIKLLLNQEEPAQLGRLLAYYGYLNRVRGENIRQVRDQLEALAALRRQETAEQERVAELAAEQRAELDR
ncbi:MAG TPA: hypothetical protein VJ947_04915, partial [Pseudohaliea sp.]|nr:hypothetical protein [Pseudohaliea sp.]